MQYSGFLDVDNISVELQETVQSRMKLLPSYSGTSTWTNMIYPSQDSQASSRLFWGVNLPEWR